MTNEELIMSAKDAKSPDEILKKAEENGFAITREDAEKFYRRFHTSGELSDEELDVSAGGCGVNYDNTCPVCKQGTMQAVEFMKRDPAEGTKTTTYECDVCHHTYENVYYEY